VARLHGRKGRLYCAVASGGTAEPIAYLNSWSFDRATDRVDVTSFGDNNKTYVAGLADASGSIGGFYDTDSAQLYTAASDGIARKFYLYPSTDETTEYFFGTAFFDFSISGGTDSAVTVSGTWSAASDVSKVG
jgi:hypothetical protein